MRSVKQLGFGFLKALPQICGGVLIFVGLESTAHAIPAAPEIDPASITGAITLLAGSVLLITGRRWKN